MVRYGYSFDTKENMAKASGRSLSISTKYAVEICNNLRGKNLEKSKSFLKEIISLRRPLPIKRFTEGAGHKPGIGPGSYPVNASKEILRLLESVTSNAQSKGLATGKLEIIHMNAHRGSRIMKRSRQQGRSLKQTHVEIVVAEATVKKEERKK